MIKQHIDEAFAIGMFQHRGEIEPFAEFLCQRPIQNVVEIGTLHGGTSVLWSRLSSGFVVTVDLPAGEFGGAAHGYTVDKCRARAAHLKNYNQNIISVLGDSHDKQTFQCVSNFVRADGVDFLFIDGDHTVEGVRKDYEDYRKLVNPGGLIAFHDVNDTPFHRENNCHVHDFWNSLEVEGRIVFTVDGPWGGIGVLIK